MAHIYFDNRDIIRLRPDQSTALGIARTFQNIRLFSDSNLCHSSFFICFSIPIQPVKNIWRRWLLAIDDIAHSLCIGGYFPNCSNIKP